MVLEDLLIGCEPIAGVLTEAFAFFNQMVAYRCES